MRELPSDGGALATTSGFLRYFKSLSDVRQRGKVIYPLAEARLLRLLAVLTGGLRWSPASPASARRCSIVRTGFALRGGHAGPWPSGRHPRNLDAEAFPGCFAARC